MREDDSDSLSRKKERDAVREKAGMENAKKSQFVAQTAWFNSGLIRVTGCATCRLLDESGARMARQRKLF
jgi:hypothetical protein